MAEPLATSDVRPYCFTGPGQSMPWVSSLFAKYTLDMNTITYFQKSKARKKTVTVKYAG